MLHTQLHGTHWQIGFQLGAGLARDGHFILDAVPFPITPARLAFARTCLPLYRRWFPAALEELRGLAEGQRCAPDELAGVLFSMYAMPPGPCCSCFALRSGRGRPVRPEQRLSPGAGRAQRQLPIPFFRRRLPFCGQHHLLPPDGGRRQQGRAGGGTDLCAPRGPPRPGLNAGMGLRLLLESCRTVGDVLRPCCAQQLPWALQPHPGAGRPDRGSPWRSAVRSALPSPLSRGGGRLRLRRQCVPSAPNGPLPPEKWRTTGGRKSGTAPSPAPGPPGARELGLQAGG